MAKTAPREVVYDAPAEKVFEVLTSPEFHVAHRQLDEAVIEAEYQEIERTDERLVFEIRSKEYERGMAGLNKDKTVDATTRAEWDLTAKSGSWTYSSPISDRVKLGGRQRIQAEGERTRLFAQVDLEVRIPLIGKKIEKLVMAKMDRGREEYDALVRQFCQKLS